MPFENLLAAIADEGERASFKTIADKYPAVKRYVELGEEVEPLLPRLRSLQYDRVFPAVEELEGWRNWKEKDWPGWETEYHRIQDALGSATLRVQELEARGDTDMNADDVKKIVKEALADRRAHV